VGAAALASEMPARALARLSDKGVRLMRPSLFTTLKSKEGLFLDLSTRLFDAVAAGTIKAQIHRVSASARGAAQKQTKHNLPATPALANPLHGLLRVIPPSPSPSPAPAPAPQVYTLEEAADAHRALEGRGTTGKLLLRPR
jgi:hypothetical protein